MAKPLLYTPAQHQLLSGHVNKTTHTIIHIVVSPLIGLVNLLLKVFWQKIDLLIFLGDDIVELMIEHPDNLAGLVADNLVLLLVVKGRNSEATRIIWFLRKVDVTQMGEVAM